MNVCINSTSTRLLNWSDHSGTAGFKTLAPTYATKRMKTTTGRRFFGKFWLALTLLDVSATASADWVKAARGFNSTSYVDPATLQRSDNTATMWVLTDYENQPFDGDNLPYLSVKMLMEYDCQGGRFRSLEISSFSGRMATGHKPYTSSERGEWKTISPTNVQHKLWDMVCAKQKLQR